MNRIKIKCEKCNREISKSNFERHNCIDTEDNIKFKSWNKGLTKETDIRVKKYSKTIKKKYENGEIIPKYKNKNMSNESRKKMSDSALNRVKNGTHKGWQSRNIRSYPEKFFDEVLKNNNLLDKCKIEYPICKEKLGIKSKANYFLDFYFEDKKLDLEIDGSQHNYTDRKEHDKTRDIYLNKIGIIVYRIKWKSINNEEGKQYIKDEIEKFLIYYNNN